MSEIKEMSKKTIVSWVKLVVFAIIAGAYTAAMAMIPAVQGTSFADIVVTFEVWILFGIIIIMKSKSALDSALKCFVFFLISQPLVYLIQDAINHSSLFVTYYRNWVGWTIATLPMGFIGYYMKKDKWWGLFILTPIMFLLGYHFSTYLGETIFSFPKHLLTTLFCAVTIVVYPICIFKNKKIKIAGVIIGIIIIIIFGALAFIKPSKYETDILINGGSTGAVFDNTYKAYLDDKSIGTLEIRKEPGLDDWVVHAIFNKNGNTEVILEDSNGNKTVYDIEIQKNTFNIKKK